MSDMADFNKGVIEEFRANGGRVGGPFEGAPLLLLTSVGAKSGAARTTPLMYLPDGERLVIFASKAGAPTNPAWYTTSSPIARPPSRSAATPSTSTSASPAARSASGCSTSSPS